LRVGFSMGGMTSGVFGDFVNQFSGVGVGRGRDGLSTDIVEVGGCICIYT